ncbi:hypothetical protein HMPREF9422_0458 [Streptococcus cristatus ATCC 51100]|nr:hypothetical protein HMPREF9422_0458 [Streptococcus cristatus ATCC 51100]
MSFEVSKEREPLLYYSHTFRTVFSKPYSTFVVYNHILQL